MRQERWNPIRIAGVQLPRQFKKLLSLAASTHRLYDDPGGWGRGGKNSQAHGGRQDEGSLNCNSTWICAQNQLSLASGHDARGGGMRNEEWGMGGMGNEERRIRLSAVSNRLSAREMMFSRSLTADR